MSGRMRRARRAVIIILTLLLAGALVLAESIEVRLNATTNVYQSKSADSRSVKAPKGLRVELKNCSDGWGKIVYKGNTGYVKLKYLDRVDPLKAYVTRNANVYEDASGQQKLTTAAAGMIVYVIGVDGSYVRIQNKSGSQKGYIKPGVLSASKPASANSASGANQKSDMPDSLKATASGARRSRIEMTIYVAQNLIGAPFASRPDPPKSFDSAHFTSYCYGVAQSGAAKGSTKDQGYDDRYEKISLDNLRRGDLVCFDTVSDNDLSDHVGIYLGKGYFLHGSSAARKVILSSLSSGYYQRTFSWGRRIFTD